MWERVFFLDAVALIRCFTPIAVQLNINMRHITMLHLHQNSNLF